jgi:hypothetical protein
MANTGPKLMNLGASLTLYLTGGILVLFLLLLFFPIGILALIIWLFMIIGHRSKK